MGKTTLFTLTIFICFLGVSYANQGYNIGIIGSYNYTKIFNKISPLDPNLKRLRACEKTMGISIGYEQLAIKRTNKKLSSSIEIFKKQYELKYRYLSTDQNWINTNIANYTNLNFLIKYKTRYGMYFECGPEISFLNSAREEHVMFNNSIAKYEYNDLAENYSKINYIAVLGIGGEIKLYTFKKNIYKLNLIQTSRLINDQENSIFFTFGSRLNIGLYDILTSFGAAHDRVHPYYYNTFHNETNVATLGLTGGLKYRF